MNWKPLFFLLITPLCALAQWTQLPFPQASTFYQETKAYVQDSFLFVYTDGVLHRTSDNGNTWISLSDRLPTEHLVLSLVHTKQYLIASMFNTSGYGGGIFHSADNGDHWVKIVDSLKDVRSVHFFLQHGESLFAYGWGAERDGIYRSGDQGLSWDLRSKIPYEICGYVAINDRQMVTMKTGHLISLDSALTWQMRNYIPYYSLASNGQYVFAYLQGLFRSDNKGENWTFLNSGGAPSNIRTLTTKGGLIFAASGGEVFYSPSNGEQWSDITGNLNDDFVYFLIVDDDYLFAMTSSGVWRYSLDQLSVATQQTNANALVIRADKKNRISVRFVLPSPEERITFEIYDILGKLVASRHVDHLDMGLNEIPLQVSLPDGVFICKVLCGMHIEPQRFVVVGSQ